MERNFAWALTAIVYITIVLTAMQVGLGTHQLKDDVGFNRASYGFTVFSILAPLIVLVVIIITLLVLGCRNWRFAKSKRVEAYEQHVTVGANPRLQLYQHAGVIFRRNI